MRRQNNYLNIIFIIITFILIQTYFQYNESFRSIFSKWTGYFIPVIWAIFMSILLDPLVEFFERKLRINKFFAISLALIFIIVVLILLFFMIIPQLMKSIKELNDLSPHIMRKSNEIIKNITSFLAEKNIVSYDPDEVAKDTSSFLKSNFDNIQKIALSIFKNILWWTVGIINFIIGLFLAILLIANKKTHIDTRNNIIVILFGQKKSDYIIKKITDSKDIFLNYIIGKIIVSFVVGVCVFLILFLTKTPYASLSAVLLGLGNMIPYVGSIIAGILSAFLIFIAAPFKIVFLIIAIVISQLIDGLIVGPKIIGDKVGLNTFWVIVSIILFGGLFGIIGMFLGIPIMCIIKLFYRDLVDTKEKK